jgi:hypothetical protein
MLSAFISSCSSPLMSTTFPTQVVYLFLFDCIKFRERPIRVQRLTLLQLLPSYSLRRLFLSSSDAWLGALRFPVRLCILQPGQHRPNLLTIEATNRISSRYSARSKEPTNSHCARPFFPYFFSSCHDTVTLNSNLVTSFPERCPPGRETDRPRKTT